MITIDEAYKCVNRMAVLQFFPKENEARVAIAEIVVELATTRDQAEWLSRRMVNLFNEWPGPRELRAVYCSKYMPRDGYEVGSTVYADGIPSERPKPELPAANPRTSIASADPEMASAITRLARSK